MANLKVVTSSQLGLVRNLAKTLHALALWLTILTFALYALAMFLARGNRRSTLMWVGSSLVFAGLFVLLGRKIGQGQLVSAITSDASIEPAANDAYSVATSLLVQVASASIIIGIPVILSALVRRTGALGVAGRRFLAPHFRERPGLAYWIVAGLLALVFLWGPIPATRNPLEMLLFTILAFVGAHVLRGQIAEEFPDACRGSLDAGAEDVEGPALVDQHEREEDHGDDRHHGQRVVAGGRVVDGQVVGGVGARDHHVRIQVDEDRADSARRSRQRRRRRPSHRGRSSPAAPRRSPRSAARISTGWGTSGPPATLRVQITQPTTNAIAAQPNGRAAARARSRT